LILVDKDIRKAWEAGVIDIDPWVETHLQPASYDICLSPEIRRLDPRMECLDPGQHQRYTYAQRVEHPFVLHPGEFILASSVERIRLPPDMVAQLSGKSSLARIGLQIEAAGYFDPGWDGQATLELANMTQRPIRLYPHMKIAQMVFIVASGVAERPYGTEGLGSKYLHQAGPTPSAMWREEPPMEPEAVTPS
jgi:dCTP deaminase